jgi:hypothetical protein
VLEVVVGCRGESVRASRGSWGGGRFASHVVRLSLGTGERGQDVEEHCGRCAEGAMRKLECRKSVCSRVSKA